MLVNLSNWQQFSPAIPARQMSLLLPPVCTTRHVCFHCLLQGGLLCLIFLVTHTRCACCCILLQGMLLFGPPGTGKTLIARQIGKMLNGKEPKVGGCVAAVDNIAAEAVLVHFYALLLACTTECQTPCTHSPASQVLCCCLVALCMHPYCLGGQWTRSAQQVCWSGRGEHPQPVW